MPRKLDLRALRASLGSVPQGSWCFAASFLIFLGCQGAVPIDGYDEGGDDGATGEGGAEVADAAPNAGAGGRQGKGGAGGSVGATGGHQGGNASGGIAGSGAAAGMNGGSAGASGSQGGAPMVEVPAGSVPMFVAVGYGGRRITSCDLGRTWIADQMAAPDSQDNEHQTYTPKGLAYGNGAFVFLSGWGNPSTTWSSTDGITWTQKKHQTGYGGVGFDDGAFVAVGQNDSIKSTDRGATWTRVVAPKAPASRENAAFDGIWASGSDGRVHILRGTSSSWMQLSGCTGTRHGGIGQSGGYAAGLGLMISVGEDGDTCGVNIATGTPLRSGKIPAMTSGKPAFVKDAFWMASGDKIHSSTDGMNWTSRTLPTNVRFELVARAPSGTYAAAALSGDSFYYSDDGQTWTKAKAPTGNRLTSLVAGAGSPSAQCPLPNPDR